MHEMPRLEAPISQTLYCCNYEEHFTRHGEAQHHGKVRGEKPGYDSANDTASRHKICPRAMRRGAWSMRPMNLSQQALIVPMTATYRVASWRMAHDA